MPQLRCFKLTRALALLTALVALVGVSSTAQAAFIVGNVLGCASTTAVCPTATESVFNNPSATLTSNEPAGEFPLDFDSQTAELAPRPRADFINALSESFTLLTLLVEPPTFSLPPFPTFLSWRFDFSELNDPDQVLSGVKIVDNSGFSIVAGPELLGIGTSSGALTLTTGEPFDNSSLTLRILTEPATSTATPVPASLALLAPGLLLIHRNRRRDR